MLASPQLKDGTIITSIEDILSKYLPAQSLRARLAHGLLWSILGSAVVYGSNLIASVITARLLGRTGFGELGMVMSTLTLFGTFGGMSLGLTSTRHIAEFWKSDPERAGRVIGMTSIVGVVSGGLMSLALFIFAPYLAAHTLNAPQLGYELRLGCGLLLLASQVGVQNGSLAGFESFKTVAKINLYRGLANLPLLTFLVYLWGLEGAVAGQVISMGINWMLNYLALRRHLKRTGMTISYRGMRSELHILYDFSLPATFSGFFSGVVIWASRTFLVNQSGGYAEMGTYSAAIRFQTIILLSGATLAMPLMPILASREGANSEKFNRVNILSSWLLGIAPALPLICFPEIMSLLFGTEYQGAGAAKTLVLLMGATAVQLYNDGLNRVMAARSLMWWNFINNTIWSLILIVASFWLVRYGAIGLAASLAAAYVVSTIFLVSLFLRNRLAPRETIFSFDTLLIWVTLAGLSWCAWVDSPLYTRAAAFLAGSGLIMYAFIRIFRGRRNSLEQPLRIQGE